MKLLNWILCYGLVLALFGCASTEKVEPVPTEELQAAVAAVVGLKKAADVDQAELLSYKEYIRGSEYLAKAERGLAGSYESDYILENAANGKQQLQAALANTRERTPNAFRILEARRTALDAGLKDSPELVDELADVDEELRDDTNDFARSLEPAEFSRFQKLYFALEIEAVRFRELHGVEQSIEQATRDDAKILAPNLLKTALLDMNEAANLIAQGPRDPKVYRVMVDTAEDSSSFLFEALEIIKGAPGTPEAIAAKIVDQNRKLARLNQDLGSLQQNLETTQSALVQTEGSLKQKEATLKQQDEQLKQKDQALKQQDEQLKSTMSNLQETESALLLQNQQLEESSAQVRLQQAMEQAMQQLSKNEAAVYQQGSRQLIIRLKAIDFKSGSAWLSASSKQLLGKVDDVLKSVGAATVTVEGHTDSVGTADLNKRLSTQRAISVANYLSSLGSGYKLAYAGYGESRPIASNETQAGRAINRRVDLVVKAGQ